MPAQWLSNTNETVERLSRTAEGAFTRLSQPVAAQRLRRLVTGLLLLWILFSVASLVWALLPVDEAQPASVKVINPVTRAPVVSASGKPIDIKRVQSWHLFGEAGVSDVPVSIQEVVAATVDDKDGIEKGARETRLKLRLRGAVASSDDTQGHAIIEFKSKQAVYSIDDKLPVSGNVTLAKVMSKQVVLDNNGTYELLLLHEESELDKQVVAKQTAPVRSAVATEVDKRDDSQATQLAQSYRDRLYQNPQSLAEVVNVSAVRVDGDLRGYRVAPGKDKQQFQQLGFKAGDLVTSVNGISMNDPANTMRLYQTLRSANEVVFELERGDQNVSLSVNLADTGNTPVQGQSN